MNFTSPLFKMKKLEPFGVEIECIKPNAALGYHEVGELRKIFEKSSLLLVRGSKAIGSLESFIRFCELWGDISVWPFGKVLELIEQEEPEDHIFDHNYVPLHWDGMYRKQVPEIQIFQCVQSPGVMQGGRTTFSHTGIVWEHASESERQCWSQVKGIYERKMAFYHSKTEAPLVTKHPTKDYPVLRYCEPPVNDDTSFINHPEFALDGLGEREFASFIAEVGRALYDPRNFYAHQWQTGDLLIADNHTLLHGREGFISGCPRHLRRVHVLGNPALNNPHLVFHK